MTTLTVTAKDEIPAVLLVIASAPAGPVEILRSDSNGTASVRLLPDQEPISGGLVVYDYESALTGTVAYEVVDSAAVSTLGSTTTNAVFPHIHAVVLPHNGVSLTAVRGYDGGRETSGSIHEPILRSDPIPVTGPMRMRAGSLEVYAGSYEDGLAVEHSMESGEVCQLRQPTFAGMDMYFFATRTRLSPGSEDTTPRRWSVDIDYREVRIPSGPLLSAAAWNFDDVTALGDFNTVEAAFATLNDLVIGP